MIFDFESDNTRQECCRIELADNRLHISKTAREGMHRNDVAVTHSGQRNEAEINRVTCDREIILQRPKTIERIWYKERYKAEQSDEYHTNVQIKQNGPDNAVIIHRSNENTTRATTRPKVTAVIIQAIASK